MRYSQKRDIRDVSFLDTVNDRIFPSQNGRNKCVYGTIYLDINDMFCKMIIIFYNRRIIFLNK